LSWNCCRHCPKLIPVSRRTSRDNVRSTRRNLHDLARDVLALAAEPGAILLTGRALAIQHLSRALKAAGLAARLKAKAYWSPGKIGLD